MIAQTPISVPMPNTRLTQLTRLSSASLGTSMPAALATADAAGEQVLLPVQRVHGDRVQRRALEVHQGAAGRIGVEHPGRRGGRPVGPHPHRHRGQRRREVAVEAGSRGRRGRAAEVPQADAGPEPR